MLTRKAAAVLTALRDLPGERAASMSADQVARKGTAPTSAQVATRAKLDPADAARAVAELREAGMVTTSCGVSVVTIRGHEYLAELGASC